MKAFHFICDWLWRYDNTVLLCYRELFPKIDVNQDKNVSDQELYEWIEQHMRKHVLRGAGKKMKDLDTNKDGKVSWEEYKESKFPASMEEGRRTVTWGLLTNSKNKVSNYIWSATPW